MLKPHDRMLFLESLQPPDGYKLDFAVGSSYSLDLNAMLAAPVAFAFTDCQDVDGRPVLDPLVLLKSVREYASRIALFCQAGKVYVPPVYQSLLSELEGSIFPCVAPLGGSFHPKVWLIRYSDREEIDPVVYRMLCLSRNLTFDRAWDTSLCLEGVLKDRERAFSINHPLGRFVESLTKASTVSPNREWKKRLKTLAKEIRRVKFEIPKPFSELAFHPIGIDGEATELPLPPNPSKGLVISPFLSTSLLSEICDNVEDVQLVSRMEQLDRISFDTLSRFERTWILDEPEPDVEADEDDSEDQNDDRSLSGLHAKLYVMDSGWNSHLLTGSANATFSAFNRNVEFMVELIGKKSKCGVGAILGEAGGAQSKEPNCLQDILSPYQPDENQKEAKDSEEVRFERQVEQVAQLLANCRPMSKCLHLGDEQYRVDVLPSRTFKKRKQLKGIELSIRPVSVANSFTQDLDASSEGWAVFDKLTCLALTEFYAVTATSADNGWARSFLLQAPIENPPESRREQVLKHLLSDKNRVLRFLLMLLNDSNARDFARLFTKKKGNDLGNGALGGLFDATLFESLLQALEQEPTRIEQVGGIISDLKKSESGRELLPEGIDEIWEPIWEVYRELSNE